VESGTGGGSGVRKKTMREEMSRTKMSMKKREAGVKKA
jgi:hypothetical protein